MRRLESGRSRAQVYPPLNPPGHHPIMTRTQMRNKNRSVRIGKQRNGLIPLTRTLVGLVLLRYASLGLGPIYPIPAPQNAASLILAGDLCGWLPQTSGPTQLAG